ncbi:MAG: DUF805 domain-containing protein [Flavobacteriales bacterium]|nr:DUF805 domain-containing protein [Flavobacteriales bacterium]
MIDYFKFVVFENYANFNGRARRSEFWYFVLASFLLSIVISIIEGALGMGNYYATSNSFYFSGGILSNLLNLALMIPSLAVGARRLHDTNKSGWLQLLWIIPIIGWIVLLVFFVQEGDEGTNQYGQDPKNLGYSTEDHLLD